MTRFLSVTCLFLIACPWIRGDQPDKVAAAKQLAEQLAQATLKGDYAWLIDHTYPPLVAQLGGRAKAIEAAELAMKQAKAQSIAVKTYRISEPGAVLGEGGNAFVVVPTVMEANVLGGKMVAKSYLLGISLDNGKTWTFADGSGLGNILFREKVLPKLPAGLRLPDWQTPIIISDLTLRQE